MAADWQKIRADYEAGESLRQLAQKYELGKSTIAERAWKGHWVAPARTPGHRTVATTQKKQHPPLSADIKLEQALLLYLKRHTYQEIATLCGYADRATAYNAIHHRMDRRIDHHIDQIREHELAILDAIHQKVWPLVMEGTTPNLWAVDRLLALSAARRQLLNLDIKPIDVLSGVTIVRSYGVEVSKV